MLIDADLDGGAIEVLDAEDPRAVTLALRPDVATRPGGAVEGDAPEELMQWFCFRVRGEPGTPCSYRIVNAGEATYADTWEGYRVLASHDGKRWLHVPTSYDGEVLSFDDVIRGDTACYAYFAPYPGSRRERLLARAARSPAARVQQIGESLEGRPITAVVWGDPRPDRPRVWIQARQHPGETMAEWFAEGVVDRLLDRRDALSAELLRRAVVCVIPCVNPDGGALGNQRTNAAGVDLNRAWIDPDPENAPEVGCVQAAMEEIGVDLFLDVHGDERSPWSFAAGCEGNPGYSSRLAALEDRFVESLAATARGFRREPGYERDAPGEGDLRTAGNWVGERFDCLSLTLEMPYRNGFSPERARRFGWTSLVSVLVSLDSLR